MITIDDDEDWWIHEDCILKELKTDLNVVLIKQANVRWEGPFNDAKDDAETYCGECDYNLDDSAEDWRFCPMCGLELVYRDEFAYKEDIEKEEHND